MINYEKSIASLLKKEPITRQFIVRYGVELAKLIVDDIHDASAKAAAKTAINMAEAWSNGALLSNQDLAKASHHAASYYGSTFHGAPIAAAYYSVPPLDDSLEHFVSNADAVVRSFVDYSSAKGGGNNPAKFCYDLLTKMIDESFSEVEKSLISEPPKQEVFPDTDSFIEMLKTHFSGGNVFTGFASGITGISKAVKQPDESDKE